MFIKTFVYQSHTFMFFLSPIEGGFKFQDWVWGVKNTSNGRRGFLNWGVRIRIPFHATGNGGCSFPVIFSNIFYLLLEKYKNTLFFVKRNSTLSFILIVLKFSSFFSLRCFELFIISQKKCYDAKPIKIWHLHMNANKVARPFNKNLFSVYPSKSLAFFRTHTVFCLGAFNFRKMLQHV